MAIPDGKPATDFSAMNREWVRAVAAEAGGLPEVSGDDNGKVLTVVTGEWEAATPAASGIPAPENPSNGDVLTYDGTTSAWVAEAPSGGLPAVSALTDDGKVLTVNDGEWKARTLPSSFEITWNTTTNKLNKTFDTILNHFRAGTPCFIRKTASGIYLSDYLYIVTAVIANYDPLTQVFDNGSIFASNPYEDAYFSEFEATSLADYPEYVDPNA